MNQATKINDEQRLRDLQDARRKPINQGKDRMVLSCVLVVYCLIIALIETSR